MNDLDFERVMVIFAHPDDAEVQCAGTIALWVEAGKRITYVVLTKGDKGTQDPSMAGDALAQIRQEEQLKAASELGVEKVLFLPNSDGELEVSLERRKILTRIIREHQPEVMITHDPWMRYQLHPDHRASGTLALDAVISARDPLYFSEQVQEGLEPCRVKRALLFASDQPDFWVDIGGHAALQLSRHSPPQDGAPDVHQVRRRVQADGPGPRRPGEVTSFLTIEVMRRLEQWLTEHIRTVDRKMAEFLTEKM